MKNIRFSRLLAVLLLLVLYLPNSHGQTSPADPGCVFLATGDIVPHAAFFNYGSGQKMKSINRRMKLTVGQPVVGIALGNDNNMNFGYWAGFLVAPFPPMVTATQGELLDRIQISWAPNPLGPFANGGFKLYRDGVFLAAVDKNTRNYNDFNVIAGRPYNYQVRGINAYGEGSPGKALGFQVPNGVVTGWVRTLNDQPVPNAMVTLTPMQGFSAFFGPLDGAFAEANNNGNFLPNTNTDWAMTFWVKTLSTGSRTIMTMSPLSPTQGFRIKAVGNNGLEVSIGGQTLNGAFAAGVNDWHHVAIVHNSGQYRLYQDGILTDLKLGTAVLQSELLSIGARASNENWSGRLDELRIYHRNLDELDMPEIMAGTASSLTPHLKYYWKMDEEQGTKSFDVISRNRLFFCGAIFHADRPPVSTSGTTNEDGYYRIESASYGTGTTFLAKPSKYFYMHRALKFVRGESDYATLPDFSMTPQATIETWVNSAGPDGTQTLISKRWAPNNSFQLQLVANGLDNDIVFRLNNQTHNFGPLGIGFHHLAFTVDSTGTSTVVTGYRDGISLGAAQLPPYTGTWSDPSEPWVLGARRSGNAYVDHYGGLIDEVALYDTILPPSLIAQHAQSSRNAQEAGLRIYFALDEGNGTRLNNSGSVLLDETGTGVGTSWTIMAPNQSTQPHVFSPGTRQVTLNPSVTSVDQVDFIDRSTVAVSGFVRYKNTDCFAKNVEILVNGSSYSPKIFTDSTGKFVIDFEPGTSAWLTPKFEDHEFLPASWQVLNVTSPIAGIVFNDVTTRTIKGVVAGGHCKLPIISNPGTPSGTVCVVRVNSINGCFQKQFQYGFGNNEDTEYELANLPPIEMTVAVVVHSDPNIFEAFQTAGGSQVDISKKDTVVDFIYYAPPEVEIVAGLEPISPTCPTIVLEMGSSQTVDIKVKETYLGEPCYLDTANLRIINGFADELLDTTFTNGLLKYKFKVGLPNPSPPYLKTMQIIASTLSDDETTLVVQGIVTGTKTKSNTFTTQLPETPQIVLRDPPGDGSYSFIEKNQKICRTVETSFEYEVGGGGGVEIDANPEFIQIYAPLGFGVGTTNGGGLVINVEGQATFKKVTEKSFEVCTSFSERFSTSDGDLVVGGENGGDVFVGAGLNVEFGFADKVTFNDTICEAAIEQVVTVSPRNFGTTFMYSEFGIQNNVIRYLQDIADAPTTTPGKRDTCLQSIARWNKILDNNNKQKAAAKFRRNISFDAGFQYEYSETSETSQSSSVETSFNTESESSVETSFEIAGAGVSGTVKFVYSVSKGEKNADGTEKGITTGFVLADDDPGDMFSVDIAIDSVYNTPVFRTKVGQSSCPWEQNTANREWPNLQLDAGSQFVAVDVPANEPAVFNLRLGNLSATNEDWTYGLTAIAASNPHGAVIKLNGQVMNNNTVQYIVPYGTSIPVTLTIERGPVEYDYDSLLVALVSECEYQQNLALSLLLDEDTRFFSPLYLGAHFIRPCSEVNINVPQQDWVIFPDPVTFGPDDIMRITVSGYNKSVSEFEKIRVQYRRSNGDGAWINIVPPVDSLINSIQPGAEIEKSNLGNVFTQFYWDTDGLADGPYEIRAIAICGGDATEKPGFSQVVKGRIERQPPSLIGVPQPSDGVYHVGDEVSFTFNKHINCTKINALDNVLLFDATTGLPIDIDITCYENKIILNPNFQNEYFENRILRAEVREIEDLTGNMLIKEIWEFYVDRNELAWLTDSLGMTKFEDQTKTAVANIHNRGGYPVPFSIIGIPDWVHIVPTQGTLAPNEIRPVHFTVDSTLAFGHWTDSITLRTVTGQNPFFMGGDEGLPFGVRVVCRPPNWQMNANLYENSMNMVLELDIQGQKSKDVEDIVVAFIGDTLCGKAKVQYVPQLGKHLAYLTIYGNPHHVLQPLRLEIWDASACLRYAVLEDYFLFQPDDVIGDPLAPQVIHTNDLVLREVPFGFGWNWLSFNLAFPDPGINAALASLRYPQNDLMKGQNAFSTYFNGSGWLGSLNTLGNTSMYVYRADVPDTLMMTGNVLDPAATPIPVVAGWNWIGYVPNYSLPVNDALASLPAQPGDLVKSQLSFAQYINPTFGWIGNLKFMNPPNGYQIKLSAPGTLVYPPPPSNLDGDGTANRANPRNLDEQAPAPNFWTVDPTQYEHSMTLIGMLKVNGANGTAATMELGAFVGEQVRGSAQALYIEPLQSYLFFLTVYANTTGEQVRYKLFDSSSGTEQDLTELMYFSPFQHQGSIEAPVPFTLPTSSSTQLLTKSQAFEVQPNPFHNETVLRFALAKAQEVRVTVTDVSGRQVANLNIGAREGLNTVIWRGQSDNGTRLANGLYYVMLQTEAGNVVRKVVLH